MHAVDKGAEVIAGVIQQRSLTTTQWLMSAVKRNWGAAE
jgi:hypothetical protein